MCISAPADSEAAPIDLAATDSLSHTLYDICESQMTLRQTTTSRRCRVSTPSDRTAGLRLCRSALLSQAFGCHCLLLLSTAHCLGSPSQRQTLPIAKIAGVLVRILKPWEDLRACPCIVCDNNNSEDHDHLQGLVYSSVTGLL